MKTTQRCLCSFAVLAAFLGQLQPAAAQTVWTGANNVSATTNWSDNLNWSTILAPADFDPVRFQDQGATGAAGEINNVVDAAFAGSIGSLQYANTVGAHTTFVPPGVILNIGGNLTAGTETASDIVGMTNTMTGANGTVLVNNPGGNLIVRQWPVAAASSANRTTLDLSGLGTFNANVSRVLVGASVAGGGNRSSGRLLLARTNVITAASGTAPAIDIGESAANNGNGSSVFLGQTNALFANTMTVGRYKERGTLLAFNSLFSNPRLLIRGADGFSRMTTLAVADSGSGSATANTLATADLSLGTVDIQADTMQVARTTSHATAITPPQQIDGTFTFNAGVVDVNTLQLGLHTSNAGRNAVGVMNVNGTALLVVNTALELGRALGGSGTATTRGVLNINGGTVWANEINADFGNANNSISITGGSLVSSNIVGPGINGLVISDAKLTVPVVNGSAGFIVTNLTMGGTSNQFNISAIPVIAGYPAQFPIVQYSGALGGAFNGVLGSLPPSTPAYTGFISNNLANGSIDLVVTGGPQPARTISWSGANGVNWDTTTVNWRFGVTPTTYNEDDFVRFDDAATGSTTVDLTATRQPSSVTVSNQTKAYGFAGSGALSGLAGITKDGAATLYITNSGFNDYTGGMNILAGTVRIGDGAFSGNLGAGAVVNDGTLIFNRADQVNVNNVISGDGTLTKQGTGVLVLEGANSYAGPTLVQSGTLSTLNNAALGSAVGPTTVSGGATLDVNARNLGAEPVLVSGTGDALNGYDAAIVNSGAQQLNALRYVTLQGNTTFGGTGRWDIRGAPSTADPANAGLSTGGNPYKLTKVGFNQVSLVGVTVDPALGDVDVQQGVFALETASTGLGNPASNLTVAASASLQLFNLTNHLNKVIALTGDGFTPSIINGAGANTIVGPISIVADAVFNVNGTSLNVAGNLTGAALTKQGTGNLILSGAATHAGTTANAGSLTVNGTHSGNVTTMPAFPAVSLMGSGTVGGAVDSSGLFSPGTLTGAGTFTAATAVFNSGTMRFNLSTNTTIGGGVNDLLVVGGALTANFPQIEISLLHGRLAAGNYRLINHGGLTGDFVPPANFGRYTFTLNTAIPNQVNLAVVGTPGSLTWNATNGSTAWDVAASPNWRNASIGLPDVYYDADDVRFADLPGVSNIVTLDAVVAPFSLTNNSSTTDFTITGFGRITGAVGLVKQGSSTLTMETTNDFTGPVSLQAGTLKVANNGSLGALPGGAVTISAGATLDVGGNPTVNNANYGAKQINVAGAGVGGNGAIINSNTNQQLNVFQRVTLTGDATFGGPGDAAATGNPGRWDIRGGTPMLDLADFTLTKVGGNQVTLVGVAVSGGNIVINGGIFSAETTTAFTGSGTITVNGAGTLGHFRNAPGLFNRPVTLNGGIIRNLATTAPGTTNSAPITLTANSTLQGSTTAAYPITFDGVISQQGGTYGITKTGAGNVIFTASHTYGGNTLISTGGLELHGSASIGNSAVITVAAGATLNAANRTDGTLTLNSGQTLAGDGTVTGNLVVSSGATVSPGTSAGALVVAGNVTFQAGSIAFMELNKLPVENDRVRATAATPTTITYGGTLQLSVIGGALQDGDSFQLFVATNYVGSFSSIVPATPGPGLTWDLTGLTNGTVRVVAPAGPNISGLTFSGGNIVLNGTGGVANAQYRVLTATDVTLPVANWTTIHTSNFDGSGNFSFTNGAPVDPKRFYRVVTP
jgi:autotransporter-associated beta strand protein